MDDLVSITRRFYLSLQLPVSINRSLSHRETRLFILGEIPSIQLSQQHSCMLPHHIIESIIRNMSASILLDSVAIALLYVDCSFLPARNFWVFFQDFLTQSKAIFSYEIGFLQHGQCKTGKQETYSIHYSYCYETSHILLPARLLSEIWNGTPFPYTVCKDSQWQLIDDTCVF